MNKSIYEKQVKIEHMKLQIKHFASFSIFLLFAMMTLGTLFVIPMLARWAGYDGKKVIAGLIISILYFVITLGLTILFQWIRFNNQDDYMIAGSARNHDVIWKYKSEILAERKLRERGLIK